MKWVRKCVCFLLCAFINLNSGLYVARLSVCLSKLAEFVSIHLSRYALSRYAFVFVTSYICLGMLLCPFAFGAANICLGMLLSRYAFGAAYICLGMLLSQYALSAHAFVSVLFNYVPNKKRALESQISHLYIM